MRIREETGSRLVLKGIPGRANLSKRKNGKGMKGRSDN